MKLGKNGFYFIRLSAAIIKALELKSTDRLEPQLHDFSFTKTNGKLKSYCLMLKIIHNPIQPYSKPRVSAKVNIPANYIKKLKWTKGEELVEVFDRDIQWSDWLRIESVNSDVAHIQDTSLITMPLPQPSHTEPLTEAEQIAGMPLQVDWKPERVREILEKTKAGTPFNKAFQEVHST